MDRAPWGSLVQREARCRCPAGSHTGSVAHSGLRGRSPLGGRRRRERQAGSVECRYRRRMASEDAPDRSPAPRSRDPKASRIELDRSPKARGWQVPQVVYGPPQAPGPHAQRNPESVVAHPQCKSPQRHPVLASASHAAPTVGCPGQPPSLSRTSSPPSLEAYPASSAASVDDSTEPSWTTFGDPDVPPQPMNATSQNVRTSFEWPTRACSIPAPVVREGRYAPATDASTTYFVGGHTPATAEWFGPVFRYRDETCRSWRVLLGRGQGTVTWQRATTGPPRPSEHPAMAHSS